MQPKGTAAGSSGWLVGSCLFLSIQSFKAFLLRLLRLFHLPEVSGRHSDCFAEGFGEVQTVVKADGIGDGGDRQGGML